MNSPLVSQTHLLDFLIELETYAAAHLKREELDSFMLLARKYFHHFPLQELLGRPLGDIFGSLFYAWRLLQKFDGSEPFIRAGAKGPAPPKTKPPDAQAAGSFGW